MLPHVEHVFSDVKRSSVGVGEHEHVVGEEYKVVEEYEVVEGYEVVVGEDV